MARILVIDPLLTTDTFGVGPGWAGPGHEVVVPETFTADEVGRLLTDAEAILTAHTPVTAAMIGQAPRLRLVAKPGAGVDNIDVGAAAARGIVVTNSRGTRGRAVAEHALFMILYLAHHGWMQDDPRWVTTDSVQLGGKRLGIFGAGAVGSLLARFGEGLEMEVLANDPARPAGLPVRFVDRAELLSESDVVVLCMPLTPQTRGMIDRPALESMRPGAFLVNVSRGPAVVTDDLLAAMSVGRLAGAGLDVTDPEPLPPDHGLRRLPNVLISPHNAGRTRESQAASVARMRENTLKVLAGEDPLDPVTP